MTHYWKKAAYMLSFAPIRHNKTKELSLSMMQWMGDACKP
ncbi:MAG: hypothetical protein QG632_676, partial [Candidatus Dependentiae bacterium]|nr:hypothetical protein [Candidatus Dependentiae bacterium]